MSRGGNTGNSFRHIHIHKKEMLCPVSRKAPEHLLVALHECHYNLIIAVLIMVIIIFVNHVLLMYL